MSTFSKGKNSSMKPPAHESTLGGKFMRSRSAGVGSGLSNVMSFPEEAGRPEQNYAINSMTGNATERITTNPTKSRTTEKGKSMDIC